MATQNHTATYLSFRENYQRRNRLKPVADDEEALLSSVPSAKYTLPPVWVDAKDACEGIISYIHDALGRMEELHKNRLVVRFEENFDAISDREIDAFTRTITKKFREAEVKLKEIGRSDENDHDDDLAIRLNVQRSLATKLQNLSQRFRKSQKEYISKLQAQRQNSSFDIAIEESSNDTASSGFLQHTADYDSRGLLSKRIQERDAEIGRITKNIEELSTIFKELAVLVIEQGSILDRIDYNMDTVVQRTEKGVMELEYAEKYQKSNRAPICITILVILIVIFFILIVAKLS